MDTFNPNQMPPISSIKPEKSSGPLIAVIVILALIILGGLYFLKTRSAQNPYAPTPTEDQITADLEAQGSSDDLDSIEADLNATNTDNLDQGAAAFQSELESSY